ncbi:MAG TPA: hypothetical protein PLL88_07270 [Anaerolineaceae bacterium]|jgi:hypothetical protein|nr:hypothetical protein [Anaerolineaceae bacterium]
MARSKRTVRASEIGDYLFCERAWWYVRQGLKNRNQAELAGGLSFHEEHAGEARRIFLSQIAGYLLLAVSVVIFIIVLISGSLS